MSPRLFVVASVYTLLFDAVGAMKCLVVPIRAWIICVIRPTGSSWRSFGKKSLIFSFEVSKFNYRLLIAVMIDKKNYNPH